MARAVGTTAINRPLCLTTSNRSLRVCVFEWCPFVTARSPRRPTSRCQTIIKCDDSVSISPFDRETYNHHWSTNHQFVLTGGSVSNTALISGTQRKNEKRFIKNARTALVTVRTMWKITANWPRRPLIPRWTIRRGKVMVCGRMLGQTYVITLQLSDVKSSAPGSLQLVKASPARYSGSFAAPTTSLLTLIFGCFLATDPRSSSLYLLSVLNFSLFR